MTSHLTPEELEVRAAFERAPAPDVRAKHLAAMAAAFEPAPAVVSKRTRRLGFTVRTGAVAAGVLLVAGSALAATGTLPDPAQNAVANAAHGVGLNLPGGDDEAVLRETPTPAEEGKARAESNRSAAEVYTEAKQAWTACVAESAPEHEGPGPFDPEEACGPKPKPSPAAQAPGSAKEDPEVTPTAHPGLGPAETPRGRSGERNDRGQAEAAEHGPDAVGSPANRR